jgi:hypothetical protein
MYIAEFFKHYYLNDMLNKHTVFLQIEIELLNIYTSF